MGCNLESQPGEKQYRQGGIAANQEEGGAEVLERQQECNHAGTEQSWSQKGDCYAGYGFEAAGSQVHGRIFLNHGEPAQAGTDDQGGHGGNPCELPQDNDK